MAQRKETVVVVPKKKQQEASDFDVWGVVTVGEVRKTVANLAEPATYRFWCKSGTKVKIKIDDDRWSIASRGNTTDVSGKTFVAIRADEDTDEITCMYRRLD